MPSRLEKNAKPNRNNPEAIAMRRIIAAEGWLSPFMKGHPLPVLTEWEKTVDLSKLDTSGKNRNRQSHEEYSRTGNYLSSVD
jgi:hypothetical protein